MDRKLRGGTKENQVTVIPSVIVISRLFSLAFWSAALPRRFSMQ